MIYIALFIKCRFLYALNLILVVLLMGQKKTQLAWNIDAEMAVDFLQSCR